MTTLNELKNLKKKSIRKIEVECEARLSKNCRDKYFGCYHDLLATCLNHNNKVVCFHCSRILKASHKSKGLGRMNPSTKYKTLDDDFFKSIDSEEKAYLLGWIASDGSINEKGFTISILEKDISCLNKLRDIICKELPIKKRINGGRNMISLVVSSKQIANNLCNHLNILPGKKSKTVGFPEHIDASLKLSFIRGLFDGDGCIPNPQSSKKRYPVVSIASTSEAMRKGIEKTIGIKCYVSEKGIEYSNNNALEFLSKIYNNTNGLHLERKIDLYWMWASWVPSLSGGGNKNSDEINTENTKFRWNKADINAIAPSKTNVTDSGYDLTLIKLDKKIGNKVFLYDTGIKLTPDFGWYFDLVPRSSIIKSGYILANSIGIIDRTYVGTVKVPLIKIDEFAPDLELPNRLVQIIPRPVIHMELIEVDELDDSVRGEGGFGSTNK